MMLFLIKVMSQRKKSSLRRASQVEKNKQLIKRRLIVAGLVGALVTGAALYLANPFEREIDEKTQHSVNSISYQNALRDPSKRQSFINTLLPDKLPDYVISVEYATPRILEELAKYGYQPPEGMMAATIPIDINSHESGLIPVKDEQIGKGCKSRIFVYESAFTDHFQQNPGLERVYSKESLYADLEEIIKNVILRNEFTDAKHFSNGLENYPLEAFRDVNGRINYPLYNIIIDISSNVAEYKGLQENPRIKNSKYLKMYADVLKGMVYGMYSAISNNPALSSMDRQFIQKLKEDFNPDRLLTK